MPVSPSTLKEIGLLIFDLDGTLVDTKTDLALSVNAMRQQMDLPPLPHELIVTYVGHGATQLVRRSLGGNPPDDQLERGTALFVEHYRRHLLDNTLPYPGVPEALRQLRDRKMAILTNKPTGMSQEILRGLGLASYFSFVYGGDSFPQKKPEPAGVLKLMQDLQVPAVRTMLVGDSDTDVLTGRNAGVWTCAVTYGFGAATLKSTPPDLLLDDMRELPPLLGGRPA
jgi:phosphoglycolate phosphatase